MFNVYQCLRYIVFGIFIASNAIIASVAVWNLSLLQGLALDLPVVSYLIFVGSFGLAFIFAVIFIELARRNAITTHVLFELCWVSFFFILELAGAVAYSALVPSKMCSNTGTSTVSDNCVSTHVLQAFTLIITITLFGYLSVLLVCCFRHGRPAWHSNIRDLAALSRHHADTSRFLDTHFIDRGGVIAAPLPRRPHLEWTYRSGLSPDYEIEHFQPPALPVPAVSSHRQNHFPTFYPQVVQSSVTTQPLQFSMAEDDMSPPPLGDWPRMDILQQPARPRKLPTTSQGVEISPPRRRPTGPRKPSGEERRPPPLDLSKITSFKNMPP